MARSAARADVIDIVLETISVCALALAIVVGVTGAVELGPAFHARGAARPLAIGLAALSIRLALGWRRSATPLTDTLARLYRVACLTVLASDAGVVLACLVTACGGLDSAGYFGAGRLFASGHLTERIPLADALPPGTEGAIAPLGFVRAAAPFQIAPRFPPGMPLVVGLVMALGGEGAAFYIPPVMAAATVPLVYAIARESLDARAALLAAVLTATNAVFLSMALQPMSDVPATFWVVLAAYFVWRRTPSPVRGAMASGMALLTRPPLALVAVAYLLTTRWKTRRGALVFSAIVLIFASAFVLYQWRIYGTPTRSGYGTAGELFTAGVIPRNAAIYGRWLWSVLTPLAFVAFVLGGLASRETAWRAGAVFAATAAPYLLYAPRFEDWEVLRFLLPAIPALLIVCVAGVACVARAAGGPRTFAILGTCVVMASAAVSYRFLQQQHLVDLWQQEERYALVARWFGVNTPPSAIAIADLHSGSLRFYSGRPALRLGELPPESFATVIGALQARGYDPYVVVEQGEEMEEAERRFSATGDAVAVAPVTRIRGIYVFHVAQKTSPK